MNKFLLAVMCVVLFNGSGRSDEAVTDAPVFAVGQTGINPQDIEIIKDLDILEHWDDLQDEKVFENDEVSDQGTTGGSHEQ